ncbi:MAG: hypothetical protein CO098_17965 [Bacteroidetes bacterium CG_4_9_14_3_um_filter_41_19]|nr:MAG: hypothetical protein CO098_17965 [Bacteroidetes bacterium CG_4_9_14_3_um_filter_41_19]
MQPGLSTKNAPSIWVVAPHFLVGTLIFLIATTMLAFNQDALLNYHISGPVLAIVHLLILGWITTVIFGALYQLIPVIMEVKLYSERLAYISLVSLLSGLIIMVLSFLDFRFQLTLGFEIGGSLVFNAMVLFAVNTLKSAARAEKKSIHGLFIQTSVIYLILTVLMGLFILFNLSYNVIPIPHTTLLAVHSALGLVGWFMMLIIGVASKLMPMFLIVHKTKLAWLKMAFWFLNAGIWMVMINAFFFSFNFYLNLISLVTILTGLLLFLRFNMDVFTRRLRRRLDIGMKLSVVGLSFLTLSIIAFILLFFNNGAIPLPGGRIEIIFGVLLFYGFFSGLILGQTYKTLPFIIWLFHYQSMVGKAKVPMPADLYKHKLAEFHLYTFIASLVSLITGLAFSIEWLVMTGILLMVITATLYSLNTIGMIFHNKKQLT